MPKPVLEPVNFASISRGALVELFERELPGIARSLADTSTSWKAKRSLTMRLTFSTDSDRKRVTVVAGAETKTPGAEAHESTAYLGKDANGNLYLFPDDPRQELLFEPPAKSDTLLAFNPKSGS